MAWLWAVVALWLGVCNGDQLADDSLRGALEAINRRQRDLADPTLYYLEHFHPPRERVMYPRHNDDDGQPEDIGYGYQKTLAPNTAGVFEAIPLPESELGSHSPGVETHTPDGKALDNIILDYIEDNIANSGGVDPHRYHFRNSNSDLKRSVFRERDISDLPDTLQNLYQGGENSNQYFENGEHPHLGPTSFRERFSPKPSQKYSSRNAQALVRNFGGLNRDTENYPGNDDDSDEYLSVLNSVWEKYQDNNPDNLDPEDLSESDIEEILEYLNHKEEKKRQHSSSYDFFNSPLAWVKRDDVLESMREENNPDQDRDEDVAKLLLEEQAANNNKRFKKRFWRGNTYEDPHKNVKRYPIAKRSSSYYTSPAVLYHKVSNDRFNQRRKKNVKSHSADGLTDPNVARELNDIFSPSDNVSKAKQIHNTSENINMKVPQGSSHSVNSTNTEGSSLIKNNSTKASLEDIISTHTHTTHSKKKRSGQKEETSFDSQHLPLEMSKKSVDWSKYFGIDKRYKKSTNKPENNEWLLDQYLKAYSISARAFKDPAGSSQNENKNIEIDRKSSDDMDAKLRAMEDMIVDQALKYTGAHEGVTDSEEVQAVKDKVIAQLAAAYSLEKMRKALSEFKSSIAAQKASAPAHTTTNAPTDVPEQKDKRVAVKKEKAVIPPDAKLEKKDSDNNIGVLQPLGHSHSTSWTQDDSCPIMDNIILRCKEIANMAGDGSESLVPLCNLHQVCFLCGSEMGSTPNRCDVSFFSEANSLCGDSPRCRSTVRRTMAAMHSLRGDPSPLGCDWQNHPCLARYLAITMR